MSEPDKVDHKPLPAELIGERQELLQGIDHIAASGLIEGQIAKSAARSGAVLDFLRQEKLRSKSAMLQDYERFIEEICQNILIEIQLNLEAEDEDLSTRIGIAARDHSSLAAQAFTGASLRDHHSVSIDIASEMLKSPEAKEAKAMEAAQYLGQGLTPAEKSGIFKAIGLDEYVKNEESMSVHRARRLIARITTKAVDLNPDKLETLVMPGIDNAAVIAPIFQNEILHDRFHDYDDEVKGAILTLFDFYKQMAEQAAQQAFMMALEQARAMAQATGKPPKQEGGGQPQ
jgi:hypothetical protein